MEMGPKMQCANCANWQMKSRGKRDKLKILFIFGKMVNAKVDMQRKLEKENKKFN